MLSKKYTLGIGLVVVIALAIIIVLLVNGGSKNTDPVAGNHTEDVNNNTGTDQESGSSDSEDGQNDANTSTEVEPEPEVVVDLGPIDMTKPEEGATVKDAGKAMVVNLADEKQSIRGFGGMNHTAWIPDLTAEQRDTAFGNDDGQLGFSILRIPVHESKANWQREVETAKRAIELGAIVFASPWNPPPSMTERYKIGQKIGNGTVYETETKAALTDAVIEEEHAGSFGSGYGVFGKDSDASIQWNGIIIGVEGTKNIDFRYALAEGTATLDVYLNDEKVLSDLAFEATGGWDKWEVLAIQIPMKTGNNNSIKLVTTGTGGPNIDRISVAAYQSEEGKRLRHDMYDAYTDHLNEFIQFMKDNGVDIYAISIQNEPDYAHDWTWWTSEEIVKFLKENAGKINTRVIAPESFQYIKSLSDPILNDPEALANMDILGAHLYGTSFGNFPYPLFKEKGEGKELWMTEVYYPNSDMDSGDKWPEALEVAHHFHASLADAEFNAYVWWYIRRGYGPMREDGTISKRGYMMAHYSKFIRPGYVRVEAEKKPDSDVFTSAYKGDGKAVIVAVNKGTTAVTTDFVLENGTASSDTVSAWMTDGTRDMVDAIPITITDGKFTAVLPARSVVTFVTEIDGE